MKKIIIILFCILLIVIVGCDNSGHSKTYSQVKDPEVRQQMEDLRKQTSPTRGELEKSADYRIEAINKNSPELCEKSYYPYDRHECFLELAKKNQDIKICARIINEEWGGEMRKYTSTKFNCFAEVVVETGFAEACKEIPLKEARNYCYYAIAIDQNTEGIPYDVNGELCQSIEDNRDMIERCNDIVQKRIVLNSN